MRFIQQLELVEQMEENFKLSLSSFFFFSMCQLCQFLHLFSNNRISWSLKEFSGIAGTTLLVFFHFYRPQRSCGKVMFLHLSVILFTGGRVWQTPPGQVPPPLPKETATAADGMHPTGMHSCYAFFLVKQKPGAPHPPVFWIRHLDASRSLDKNHINRPHLKRYQ